MNYSTVVPVVAVVAGAVPPIYSKSAQPHRQARSNDCPCKGVYESTNDQTESHICISLGTLKVTVHSLLLVGLCVCVCVMYDRLTAVRRVLRSVRELKPVALYNNWLDLLASFNVPEQRTQQQAVQLQWMLGSIARKRS